MPSVGAEIVITGADELILRYSAGDAMAETFMMEAMTQSLDYAGTDVAEYPPFSEANQPPPPYYIRGTGTQYATYNRNESEQLGQSWGKEISKEDEGIIGSLEPVASYAPYAHGIQSQILVHANRGWRKVSQIAEEIAPVVQEFFGSAARKLSAFLAGG